MNCLLYVSSSAAVWSKSRHFITRTPSFGLYSPSLWKRTLVVDIAGVKCANLDSVLSRFRVQCFSSARRGRQSSSQSRKPEAESAMMEEDKNAFYVVRKGDLVGVYKSLSECQAQVGSSVCDPSVSVYKGHSLPEEAAEYLTARGLQNALYCIGASDLKEDLFGTLVPCPFQIDLVGCVGPTFSAMEDGNIDPFEPGSLKGKASRISSPPKRSKEALESGILEAEKDPSSTDALRKHLKLENSAKKQTLYSKCDSCTLQFDGASKGNPGKAGAGAILRAVDGSLVCRLREGVGIATCNAAEYRAIILGMKYALSKGFRRICVQGDSKLVCMQVQGQWKTKNENMATLCKVVNELKDKFLSFEISHVLREFNSDADAQANFAVNLQDGEVQVEWE